MPPSSNRVCTRKISAMKHSVKIRSLLRMWRKDDAFRALTGAAAASACTALFALYHGYLGFAYRSVWYGSIGVFYLLLTAVRGAVLLAERRNRLRPEREQELRRQRTFLLSSFLLLAIDLALIWPIAMMVKLARPVSVGMIPAIAMAAYTTWKITFSSVHIRRPHRRPSRDILVAELRTVHFIDALVSVLTLQNTLIMVSGTKSDQEHMLPVSAASSAVIYIVIVFLTVRMLRTGMAQRRAA